MTLLDFARGPAMQFAIIVLVLGVTFRLVGVWALRHKPDLSEPRQTGAWKGGLKGLVQHAWPYKPFRAKLVKEHVVGYVIHLGLLFVILFYQPHILFFQEIFGFGWPALPNGAITAIAVITVAALIIALINRITDPVRRMLSNFDDYFSWFVTTLPFVTGLATAANMWGHYETGLAIHLLSVWLLLIYFPFGKLMHAFWFGVSRYTTGSRFARRGGMA
ncbi:MAG: nitrate reductase [Pseudomonadota bacterium]